MDTRALIQLVVKMREHQKKFFRTRSNMDLEASKALETRVDAALRDHLNPSLFDRQVEGASTPPTSTRMIAEIDDTA